MTKKDYELIASALKSTYDEEAGSYGEERGVVKAAKKIAEKIAEKNESFKKETFLQACGVQKS